MQSTMNLFFFISLLVIFNSKNMRLLLLSSSSDTKLFELRSLPRGYLTFLGDSHLRHNKITLTKEHMVTNSPTSAGVVLYKNPVLFFDSRSRKVRSFHTSFAFYVENIYGFQKAFGDGLAFLISPDHDLLGSPGYLGLVDSTDLSKNKFIAIEFDTRCDSMFLDPDDNHVGVDINSLSSVKLATSSSLGVDLKSGDLIYTWIDYKSDEKGLEVFLGDSYLKPKKPLLKVEIDLSYYLKEKMFVGFSAATEGNMQVIHIEQWEFSIAEISPPPPPPPSPLDLGRTFPNPSVYRHSHLSKYAIGLTIAVCSVPFVALFGWFCCKKLLGMIQKSEGTNNVEMQTIRSSGGISCQEIQFSILFEVVSRLNFDKVLAKEAELTHINTVKSRSPPCISLPAVIPSRLSLSNSLPLGTNDVTSVG